MKKKKANNPTEKGAKDGNKKLIEKEMRIALTWGSQNLSHEKNCNLNYTDTHTQLVQNLLTALFQRVRNQASVRREWANTLQYPGRTVGSGSPIKWNWPPRLLGQSQHCCAKAADTEGHTPRFHLCDTLEQAELTCGERTLWMEGGRQGGKKGQGQGLAGGLRAHQEGGRCVLDGVCVTWLYPSVSTLNCILTIYVIHSM